MTEPTDTGPTDTGPTDTGPARRLDGNAAGGALAALFAVDMTAALSRCAACGTSAALGAHHLYADAPALVLRCPSCTEVVLRFASRTDDVLLDLRGAALLVVPTPAPADDDPRPGRTG